MHCKQKTSDPDPSLKISNAIYIIDGAEKGGSRSKSLKMRIWIQKLKNANLDRNAKNAD